MNLSECLARLFAVGGHTLGATGMPPLRAQRILHPLPRLTRMAYESSALRAGV
ncbi:MAG: hypothetical protein JOZ10_15140 [Acidobacteria bacterium]|nr:hypothetical protein [Acidobacteriota bacterium]